MKKSSFCKLLVVLFVLLCQFSFSISLNFSVHHSSCGASNGSIEVYVSGGQAPYNYQWTTGATTYEINNLSPGNYTVTVTDFNGNSQAGTATVNIVNQLNIDSEDEPAQGATASGSIQVIINAGTAPFTIASVCNGWSPTITQFVGSNFTIDSLYAYNAPFQSGNGCEQKQNGIEYEFIVTDAAGCSGEISELIRATGVYVSPSTSGSCGSMGTGKIHDTLTFNNGVFPFLNGAIKILVYSLPSNSLIDSVILIGNSPGSNTLIYEMDSLAAGNYLLEYYLPASYQGPIQFSTTPYTTSTVNIFNLGLSCGNVFGTVFFDADGNCLQGINEHGLINSLIEIQPGNNYTFTDSLGHYEYSLPLGNYTIQHTPFFNAALLNVCPGQQPVAFSVLSPQQQIVQNFADSSFGKDIALRVFLSGLRPGFNSNFVIVATNASATNTYSDTIDVHFDNQFNVNFTQPSAFSVQPGHVRFLLDSLPAFSKADFIISVHLPADTSLLNTRTVADADYITTGDYNHSNNNDSVSRVITGSMDPNQVTVNPEGFGIEHYVPRSIDNYRYFIEFQNTGTDTAFNVIVRDTIDEYLDLATFVPMTSSHPYTVQLNGRVATFTFSNILLPDSNANEEASHGYIAYAIAPLGLMPVGTEINTRASIYFDFNPPVTTNTCSLTQYSCDSMFLSLPLNILACEGSTISFGATLAINCPLNWWLDGIFYSSGPNINIPNLLAGSHVVMAEAVTPYCTDQQSYQLFAATLPDANVTVNGDTLNCDPNGVSYQWYLNGVAIPGADSTNCIATVSGNYSVQIISFIGCSNTSIPTHVSITGVNSLAGRGIAMFPNPGRERLHLIFPERMSAASAITIFAIDGRKMFSEDITDLHSIDLATDFLSSGIYNIEVRNSKGRFVAKWVKD